jgi:hypothetical protein
VEPTRSGSAYPASSSLSQHHHESARTIQGNPGNSWSSTTSGSCCGHCALVRSIYRSSQQLYSHNNHNNPILGGSEFVSAGDTGTATSSSLSLRRQRPVAGIAAARGGCGACGGNGGGSSCHSQRKQRHHQWHQQQQPPSLVSFTQQGWHQGRCTVVAWWWWWTKQHCLISSHGQSVPFFNSGHHFVGRRHIVVVVAPESAKCRWRRHWQCWCWCWCWHWHAHFESSRDESRQVDRGSGRLWSARGCGRLGPCRCLTIGGSARARALGVDWHLGRLWL